VHALYFACSRHFGMLLDSVRSLERLGSPLVGDVYVCSDRGDPLQPRQIAELRAQTRLTVVDLGRSGFKLSGYSPKTVLSELRAFVRVGDRIRDADIVAKLDCDILFYSDRIFGTALEADCAMAGHAVTTVEGGMSTGKYWTQGGCYFLTRAAIRELPRLRIRRAIEVACLMTGLPFASCAEDAVIMMLARKLGEVKFFDFMTQHCFPHSFEEIARKLDHDWTRRSLFHATGCRDYWQRTAEYLSTKCEQYYPDSPPQPSENANENG